MTKLTAMKGAHSSVSTSLSALGFGMHIHRSQDLMYSAIINDFDETFTNTNMKQRGNSKETH
jgi:hypothetical protein